MSDYRRACKEKARFVDRAAAERAIEQAVKFGKKHPGGKKYIPTPYECPHCGTWHWGHQRKESPAEYRRRHRLKANAHPA